jgi:hypothetical protein
MNHDSILVAKLSCDDLGFDSDAPGDLWQRADLELTRPAAR